VSRVTKSRTMIGLVGPEGANWGENIKAYGGWRDVRVAKKECGALLVPVEVVRKRTEMLAEECVI